MRGVEAMSVKRFQRYGCFRENFFFEPKVKIRIRLCLAFVFVFVFVYLCICICVFVFVFDHDHLLFWFIFDENPFLRLRLASHDNLGVAIGTGSVLGDRASETLSEGIPAELFDSPRRENCRIGPK